jgi:isochorismate hydrolase
MNKLKLDFDTPPAPPKKAKQIPYKKSELLLIIGQTSINWSNRETVLNQVSTLNMTELKNWCKRNNIPVSRSSG